MSAELLLSISLIFLGVSVCSLWAFECDSSYIVENILYSVFSLFLIFVGILTIMNPS